MFISDLSYLETIDQEATVVGSGGVNFNSNIKKRVDIQKKVYFDINKYVESNVRVRGNLATAQATADAFGRNSLSETDTMAQATNGSSESYSESIAAVNGGGHYYPY
jgi:hypothetical protein